MRKLLSIIVTLMFSLSAVADITIEMENYNGVYRIPCTVNGAKMKFIFDTGASNVCISLSMAEYLYDNGFLKDEDILGNGQSTVADGSIVDHVVINLRDIEIQGLHLHDVQAVVMGTQNAPLLMGQSAIQKLGTVQLQGSLLTIHNEGGNDDSFIDDLFAEAQEAYKNKLYDRAAAKYGRLYSMKQLSDYGVYRYAWALLMNDQPSEAKQVIDDLKSFDYFEKEKIDIYRLIGFINQDLNKYDTAAKYFELSSKKIQTEYEEWLQNFIYMGDCHYNMNSWTEAANNYRMAVMLHGEIHNIDMKYMQADSKNRLKKNQQSYRNDNFDYALYRLFFCNERSGAWSTDGFLMEAAAMARAGNKYAGKMFNSAGMDPYAECWR